MNPNPWVTQDLIHHRQADISRSTRHTWIERPRRGRLFRRLASALSQFGARSDSDRRHPTPAPRRVAVRTGDAGWTPRPDAR